MVFNISSVVVFYSVYGGPNTEVKYGAICGGSNTEAAYTEGFSTTDDIV